MSKTRFILVALICVTPIILLWDGLVVQGAIAGVVGIALTMTATGLRPGETEFLITVIRPAMALAAVPALWIGSQILPLGVLAHPIWASAVAALGHKMIGAISVDLGASVIALGQYLILCAIALLSAAVAVDRGRAQSLLFALTAACAAIAVIVLADNFHLGGLGLSASGRAQAIVCVAMGAIFAIAACIRTLEQYEAHHGAPSQSSVLNLRRSLIACGVALAFCVAGLIIDGTREVLFATACGAAAFACIVIIRWLGLRAWSSVTIAVLLAGIAILVVVSQPIEHGRSLLLAFASSDSSTDLSERVLDDAPLLGTGAGTFGAIAPIYHQMDDPPPGFVAATASATLMIELGRPMLWLIITATAVAIIIFLKASLQRGRDSFYPATGASCLITLLALAFINAGLLGDAAGLIAAVALGLAIAQSRSRTIQRP